MENTQHIILAWTMLLLFINVGSGKSHLQRMLKSVQD